ncbi:proteinase-activated receptor 3-like [Lepisosteus oculatus]|nr:PREDICTED: proteinase-activated receptor 3-like [Lepisosteus oculatus]XP_015196180.1 PREDICTED: proteinase-activated receptor 3-like [Lepisosteus oculatus]XP_015196181.1 PREDICTED: proteinase-activated receptor 3-like [Lepisosteus oculatus]XP_015196182.1 PREDICTED: proteinase-activated receptor 3-like [Lepisosteus oculatus]
MVDALYTNSSPLPNYNTPNATVQPPSFFEECKVIPAGPMIYVSAQAINIVLGLPANLMVLWLLRRTKADFTTSDIFILNLAILDTFFCLMSPVDLLNRLLLNHATVWQVQSVAYGIKDGSPLLLTCICLDRYLAVLHPITFTKFRGQKHRIICAEVLMVIIISYAISYAAGAVKDFHRVFSVMILTIFSIMVFCNLSILWALKRSGPGRDEMHPVKKKAFNMVLIILAIIVFHYFPPVILFPFQNYFSPLVFKCYVHHIAFAFMDLSSSVQPLLYLSRIVRLPCFLTDTVSDTSVKSITVN